MWLSVLLAVCLVRPTKLYVEIGDLPGSSQAQLVSGCHLQTWRQHSPSDSFSTGFGAVRVADLSHTKCHLLVASLRGSWVLTVLALPRPIRVENHITRGKSSGA